MVGKKEGMMLNRSPIAFFIVNNYTDLFARVTWFVSVFLDSDVASFALPNFIFWVKLCIGTNIISTSLHFVLDLRKVYLVNEIHLWQSQSRMEILPK